MIKKTAREHLHIKTGVSWVIFRGGAVQDSKGWPRSGSYRVQTVKREVNLLSVTCILERR